MEPNLQSPQGFCSGRSSTESLKHSSQGSCPGRSSTEPLKHSSIESRPGRSRTDATQHSGLLRSNIKCDHYMFTKIAPKNLKFSKPTKGDFRSHIRLLVRNNTYIPSDRRNAIVTSLKKWVFSLAEKNSQVSVEDVHAKLETLGLSNESFPSDNQYYRLITRILNFSIALNKDYSLKRDAVPFHRHVPKLPSAFTRVTQVSRMDYRALIEYSPNCLAHESWSDGFRSQQKEIYKFTDPFKLPDEFSLHGGGHVLIAQIKENMDIAITRCLLHYKDMEINKFKKIEEEEIRSFLISLVQNNFIWDIGCQLSHYKAIKKDENHYTTKCFCPLGCAHKRWRDSNEFFFLNDNDLQNTCYKGIFDDPYKLWKHCLQNGKQCILHYGMQQFLQLTYHKHVTNPTKVSDPLPKYPKSLFTIER